MSNDDPHRPHIVSAVLHARPTSRPSPPDRGRAQSEREARIPQRGGILAQVTYKYGLSRSQ